MIFSTLILDDHFFDQELTALHLGLRVVVDCSSKETRELNDVKSYQFYDDLRSKILQLNSSFV